MKLLENYFIISSYLNLINKSLSTKQLVFKQKNNFVFGGQRCLPSENAANFFGSNNVLLKFCISKTKVSN